MTETLTVAAPAKLNLFLHITGRRADGYHELQTLFQLLDFGDTLHFTRTTSGDITLDDGGLDIPAHENLIVRAARALQSGNLGVDIRLEKRIPAGGGLGGGSSDCATALLALNQLWELGHSSQALMAIGARLGADVPVFVGGRTAWAEGVGERLTPVDMPARWYLVLVPQIHVSTGKVFSHPQLTRNSAPIKMAAFFDGHSRNDTQPLVRELYPEVDKALKMLGKFGEPRLTGTGACVFTSFEHEADAKAAREQLPEGCESFLARGINVSPALPNPTD